MRYTIILLVPLLALFAACDDDAGNEPTPSPSPPPVSQPPATAGATPTPLPQTVATIEDGVYIVRHDGSGVRGPFTGFRAAWSPDGKSLVVVTSHCDRTLSMAAGDSAVARQIASFPNLTGFISSFRWASDSSSLLVGIQDPSGPNRVFLVAADGGNEPRELFQSLTYAWSPDGSQIAYAGSDVNLINVATGNVRTIATNAAASGFDDLAWSPDGTKLSYSSSNRIAGITIVGVDGGQLGVVSGSGAAWMPDSERIMFRQLREQFRLEVAIARASDGVVERVLRDGSLFDLSRDGKMAAVYDNPGDGTTQIEVFDLQGETQRIVSGDLTPAGDALALSPDGSQVIFNAEAPEHVGRRDLYIVNSNGTGLRKLVESARGIGTADWSADGERIAFVAVPPIGLQC